MALYEAAQAINQLNFKTPHSGWYVFFWSLGLLLVVVIVVSAAALANQAEYRREAQARHRHGASRGSSDQ